MLCIESYLYKKGKGKIDGWKRRYCRLKTDQKLYYYNDINDSYKIKTKIKYIDLNNLNPKCINVNSNETNKKEHAIYGFSILTKNREWKFCTTSELTYEKWVISLVNIVNKDNLYGLFQKGKSCTKVKKLEPNNKKSNKVIRFYSENWIYGKLAHFEYITNKKYNTVHVVGSWNQYKGKHLMEYNENTGNYIISLQLLCKNNYFYRFWINEDNYQINKYLENKYDNKILYNVIHVKMNTDDKKFFNLNITNDDEKINNNYMHRGTQGSDLSEVVHINMNNNNNSNNNNDIYIENDSFSDDDFDQLYERVATPKGPKPNTTPREQIHYSDDDVSNESEVYQFAPKTNNIPQQNNDDITENDVHANELPSSDDEGNIDNNDDSKERFDFSMDFINKDMIEWNTNHLINWLTTVDISEYKDITNNDIEQCKQLFKIFKLKGSKVLSMTLTEWNELFDDTKISQMIRQEIYDYLKQLNSHNLLLCKHNVILNKGILKKN